MTWYGVRICRGKKIARAKKRRLIARFSCKSNVRKYAFISEFGGRSCERRSKIGGSAKKRGHMHGVAHEYSKTITDYDLTEDWQIADFQKKGVKRGLWVL